MPLVVIGDYQGGEVMALAGGPPRHADKSSGIAGRAGRTESGGRRGARLAASAGSVGTISSSPRGQIAGDRREREKASEDVSGEEKTAVKRMMRDGLDNFRFF
jgi:hypothetical protein